MSRTANYAAMLRRELDVITDLVRQMRRAEAREIGHECGHAFTITETSTGHLARPADGGTHEDAPPSDDPIIRTVTVRAWSLPEALLIASTLPLHEWDTNYPEENA